MGTDSYLALVRLHLSYSALATSLLPQYKIFMSRFSGKAPRQLRGKSLCLKVTENGFFTEMHGGRRDIDDNTEHKAVFEYEGKIIATRLVKNQNRLFRDCGLPILCGFQHPTDKALSNLL